MGSVVVALKGVIFHGEKMLIVKRSDSDDTGAGTWEFPGGKLEFGENPKETLLREIKEEVGLDVTVDRVMYASSFMSNPSRQVIIIAYRCRTNETNVILSNEHSCFLWTTRDEVGDYLPSNRLADLRKHQVI